MCKEIKSKNEIFISHDFEKKLNIFFEIEEMRIYNIGTKINVEITKNIELNRISDLEGYVRSDKLLALGILSFLLEEPLHVGNYTRIEKEYIFETEKSREIKEEVKFIVSEKDMTKNINTIVNEINIDKKLLSSLLDRYRKASVLFQENEMMADNNYEEIYLILFGIIEILANKSNDIEKIIIKNINNFLKGLYSELLYSEEQVLQKVNESSKYYLKIVKNEEVNIKNKILLLLEKINIETPYLDEYIKRLIKIRNEIAHGNLKHDDFYIFPYPAYYSILKNKELHNSSHKLIVEMFILTRLIIFKYFKLNDNELLEKKFYSIMEPPDKLILKNLETGEINKLIENKDNSITYDTLFFFLLKENKKNRKKYLEVLKNEYLSQKTTFEKEIFEKWKISILFCELQDKTIEDKAYKLLHNVERIELKDMENILKIYKYNFDFDKFFRDF